MLQEQDTAATPHRTHQPDEGRFHAIRQEDLHWVGFAAYPPDVRLAVVVGDPSASGPYTIRVRVPADVKMMPHKHPEDRVYTVISGVFYIGLGDTFDELLGRLKEIHAALLPSPIPRAPSDNEALF